MDDLEEDEIGQFNVEIKKINDKFLSPEE